MPKALSNARFWHYLSLGAGLVAILVLQWGQWFYFDEWAFITPTGPGAFEPHVGHWSTSPFLIFKALIALFGLNSYLPFAIIVTLIHLAVAHLVWRIMLRCGARPWVATALAAVLIVYGAGAENILWAFQIGFMGALALGLLTVLLASRPTLTGGRFALIAVLSVFSLTWSGTSIPLVVATALVLWFTHGWRPAVLVAAISGTVYLIWYAVFALGSANNPDTGGISLEKIFIDIPRFLGVMLIVGFSSTTPVPFLGFVALLGLAAWIIVLLVKKAPLRPMLPGFALLLAAILFAFLSAYARASFSVGGGRSPRYIYVLLVFLLPLFAVAISRFATSRLRVGIAATVIAVIGVYQGVTLVQAAIDQSTLEQHSRHLISASLSLYLDDPSAVNLDAGPDPRWAPDLEMADLVELYDDGSITVGDFDADDLAEARENVAAR